MTGERIGIYGGSFSPPHNGHLRALSAFIESEKPHNTLVIPALVPPHKQLKGDATPEQRLAMCRLAFGELPVTVSDMELRRGGTSYTVLTLRELKREDNTLLLLCGTDMFLTLNTWYHADEIFALADIVYMRREEDAVTAKQLAECAVHYRRDYAARVRELVCPPLEVSSTVLRQKISNGEDTDGYLAPAVREYIEQCKLYRT